MSHRKRVYRLASLTALALGAVLGILVFAPGAYVVEESFRLPHTFRGLPVTRYGYSHVNQKSNADYVDGTGANVHSGRSFVDYVENGETRRAYGWCIQTRATPDRSSVRVKLD